MKLVISPLNALDHFVTREFAYIIRELIEGHGWRHLEVGRLGADPRPLAEVFRAELGEVPEVVLIWESYGFLRDRMEQIRALDGLKAVFADDLHRSVRDGYRYCQLLSYMICDVVFSTYGYAFHEFYPEARDFAEVVWVPHSASPDFLLPYNEEPRDAILLSGALHPVYPLRMGMKALFDEGRYPIVHHPHPGYHRPYDYRSDPSVGPRYARLLNEHRVAFTDCLIHRYLVAKYFEIPATGALLLADRGVAGPLGRLGFVEDVHYVPVSADDLEGPIRRVLDPANRPELDAMRKRAQALVRERHKSSDRARLIEETCRARCQAGRPPASAPIGEILSGPDDESRRLFAEHRPGLGAVSTRLVRDLADRGIAITSFDELFEGHPTARWATIAAIGERFLASEGAATSTRAYHQALEEWDRSGRDPGKLPVDYHVRGAGAQDDEGPLFALGLEAVVLDAVNGFFGLWAKLRQFGLSISLAPPSGVDRPRSGAQEWHRDNWDQVKVFLYFADVDEGNGPLEYIPGSRRGGRHAGLCPMPAGSGPKGYLHPSPQLVRDRVPDLDRVACNLPSGSIVFCDTSGLHRGGYAVDRPRLVASWAYYRPSSLVGPIGRNIDTGPMTEAARFALA